MSRSTRSPARRWLATVLLACLPALAAGDETRDWLPFLRLRQQSFSFVTENDKYFAGTDRHYTNGLKLIWIGETSLNESKGFVGLVGRHLPWLEPEHKDWHYKVGFALGQNIYTPGDIETTALVADDRPYAAWLYGSILLHAQLEDQLRLVEVSAGVVGPSALGRQAQNGWHDVIQVPHALGWANQLHDEPGLQLSWERRYRTWQWTSPAFAPLGVDFVARHRVTLGNVHTALAGGGLVRVGWRLPADFGPDLIRPGGGGAVNSSSAQRGFSAYLFASGEARLIAHDIFLDGNTWTDSHSVRKRPIMADMSVGLVLSWPRFQVAYTQNYRTREFYGQGIRDVFGSIGMTWTH